MHFNSLFPVLVVLSRTVSCVPTPELEARSIETILYKRGEVLDQRSLELAALHGVDINEMFRHSLVKRSDGDDITIWVHNSFNETIHTDDETPHRSVKKRGVRFPTVSGAETPAFRTNDWSKARSNGCGHSSFIDLTSASLGAYTGGVEEMRRWGRANTGAFWMTFRTGKYPDHTGLLIAGSNSGANACFMTRKDRADAHLEYVVGADDIADLARDSLQFQRQYGTGNGGWKTAAAGAMRCPSGVGTVGTDWRLTYINQRV